VLCEVRAIMNKIAPQTFDKLTQDLIALSLNSKEERLKGAIDIIFEKAIDEPNYSQTYAQVCVSLSKTKLQKGDTQVLFRSILLNRCQKEFHTDYFKEINYDQWLQSRLIEI
jgi:translation initiation factor 4G